MLSNPKKMSLTKLFMDLKNVHAFEKNPGSKTVL